MAEVVSCDGHLYETLETGGIIRAKERPVVRAQYSGSRMKNVA